MLDRLQQDARRKLLEEGPGGDKDVPFRLQLPFDWRVVDCWMRLLARWTRGEFDQDTEEDDGGKDGTRADKAS
jgi:hypothetical protein